MFCLFIFEFVSFSFPFFGLKKSSIRLFFNEEFVRVDFECELERALSIVADEKIELQCAGRTDAGVNATGQVIHFDVTKERPDRGWIMGTNTNLPDDIAVSWAKHVDDGFHARFSAKARRYRYIIQNT